MALASIATRVTFTAQLIRKVVPAGVPVTAEEPNRVQVGRAGEKDYLLVLSESDRFIEVIRPVDGHRLGILELASALPMIRRHYEDTDVAAYRADDWMFGTEDAHVQGTELETFLCRECGEEHPVVPGPEDSLWCDCGARLDDQRDRITDAAP
jgi:hypothetical protein